MKRNKIIAELNDDSIDVPEQINGDNYTIHIGVDCPQIPIIQGNVTVEVTVPKFWIDPKFREV